MGEVNCPPVSCGSTESWSQLVILAVADMVFKRLLSPPTCWLESLVVLRMWVCICSFLVCFYIFLGKNLHTEGDGENLFKTNFGDLPMSYSQILRFLGRICKMQVGINLKHSLFFVGRYSGFSGFQRKHSTWCCLPSAAPWAFLVAAQTYTYIWRSCHSSSSPSKQDSWHLQRTTVRNARPMYTEKKQTDRKPSICAVWVFVKLLFTLWPLHVKSNFDKTWVFLFRCGV